MFEIFEVGHDSSDNKVVVILKGSGSEVCFKLSLENAEKVSRGLLQAIDAIKVLTLDVR